DLEALLRGPGERHRALRPPERAREAARTGLRELRVLAAGTQLQRPAGRERAVVVENELVTVLGHAARARGERDFDEIAGRIELEEPGGAIEPVERGLGIELPRAAEHVPTIFGAADPFAAVGKLRKATTGRGRAVGGNEQRIGAEPEVVEPLQPDQLETPGAQRKLDVAAEFVAVAALAVVEIAEGIDTRQEIARFVVRG